MKTTTKKTGAKFVLLCALTLMIGLMLTGVITASANGEGTTPATHTHFACGEATCTHAGNAHTEAVTYTALTQTMLDSTYDADAGKYIIPAGSYHLAENITVSYIMSITADVRLCLNGFTLTSSNSRDIEVSAGTTSVCDCSAEGVGKLSMLRFYVTGEGTVLNIYSGNYEQTNTSIVTNRAGTTANIYGGNFRTKSESGDIITTYANLNIYGGSIQGSRHGINSTNGANTNVYGGTIESTGTDSSDSALYVVSGPLNIYGGTIKGGRYGIYSSVGGTISQAEGQTLTVHGGVRAVYVAGFSSNMTIGDGTYTSGDEEGRVIEIRGKTSVVGAPDIEGYLYSAVLAASASGEIALDVTGYTGTEKLKQMFGNVGTLKQDTVVAKGSSSQMTLPYNGWELVDAVDALSNGILKLNHKHMACGETTCTHAGEAHTEDLTWTSLTQELLDSYLETDRGAGLSDAYMLPAGNYVLGENLNIDYNILMITGDTTICFSGRTISGYRPINFIETGNITLNLTDCQGTGGMRTRTALLSEVEKVGLTINVYGGTHELLAGNIFSINSVSTVFNMYGGTLKNSSSANVSNATFNMYGGSIEAANFALSINNATANFYGGKLVATGTDSNTAALRVVGTSVVNITKLQIESTKIGIYSSVLANVTIQPEKDEDVTIHVTGFAIYVMDNKSATADDSIKEGDGTPESWTGTMTIKGGIYTGSPYAAVVEEGKLVIDGGVFSNTAGTALMVRKGIAIVNGGSFRFEGSGQNQAANVQAEGELIINGGSFEAVGASVVDAVAAVGKLKITGNPTFNNCIRIWNISMIAGTTEYWLDFSGYTGTEKLTIRLISTIAPSAGLIVARGSAEKLTLDSTEWTFANATDENGDALVIFACAGHQGDETATCTTPGICTVCGGYYTLPHTYGEWHEEIPATCVATGMKGYQTCSVCTFHYDAAHNKLESLTLDIDEHAHAWGTVTYTWAEDNTTCTAERVCTLHAEHKETETVNTVKTVTQPQGCTQEELSTFTAPFTNPDFVVAPKTGIKTADAIDHAWGAWTVTTAAICTTVGEEKRVCTHDATHTETRVVPVLGHVMTNTATSESEHWSVCSRCGAEDTKIAHTYTDGVCICGVEETGLPGGAIAAIVIVSVLIVGIGGFSIFWFAVKKKNFKDLIAVFKK